jgi:hypothetical protein
MPKYKAAEGGGVRGREGHEQRAAGRQKPHLGAVPDRPDGFGDHLALLGLAHG